MALIFADRVKETTTSTGTGPLTLAGAVAGFEPFSSVCADGDTAYYCVTDGTSWEVGLGTYASNVLTRTSVLSSSNAGAAVSLNPGSKDVVLTVPAAVISALVTSGAGSASIFALGPPVSPGAAVGQFYYDTDAGDLPYVWDGSAWITEPAYVAASDAANIANTAIFKAQPQFGSGDPNANSVPTDGTSFYYFDYSTSPYTMWVLDQPVSGIWQQVA